MTTSSDLELNPNQYEHRPLTVLARKNSMFRLTPAKDFKKEAILRIKEKGSDLYRAGLLGMDSGNTQEARELQWELLLEKLAQEAGIELTKLPDKKSAPDKVILASLMKARNSVSNSWLAAHLGMGRPTSVSQYVGRLELIKGDGWKKKERILSKMKI